MRALRRPPRSGREQLLRFLTVGAAGYVLAMALYAGQIAAGVSPYAAVPLTFVANGLFNFALNRAWSFPASGRSARSELRRFAVVAMGSLVVNYAALYALLEWAGAPPVPAQGIAIVAAAPVGFLGNKLWAFGSG